MDEQFRPFIGVDLIGPKLKDLSFAVAIAASITDFRWAAKFTWNRLESPARMTLANDRSLKFVCTSAPAVAFNSNFTRYLGLGYCVDIC